MEFETLISRRRSIRAFTHTPITEAELQSMLHAATMAPTAGNLQAFEIVVVAEPEVRKALSAASLNQSCITQAPLVLVFLANSYRSAVHYRERGAKLYCIQDATIAATFAMLKATDLGLGSVWVGAFHENRVLTVLNLEAPLKPVALLAIGHPAESPIAPPRRSTADLILSRFD